MSDFLCMIPTTPAGNLACPFCGGIRLSKLVPKDKDAEAFIHCDSCGATGPNLGPETGWNTRAFGREVFRPTNQ